MSNAQDVNVGEGAGSIQDEALAIRGQMTPKLTKEQKRLLKRFKDIHGPVERGLKETTKDTARKRRRKTRKKRGETGARTTDSESSSSGSSYSSKAVDAVQSDDSQLCAPVKPVVRSPDGLGPQTSDPLSRTASATASDSSSSGSSYTYDRPEVATHYSESRSDRVTGSEIFYREPTTDPSKNRDGSLLFRTQSADHVDPKEYNGGQPHWTRSSSMP